MLVLALSLGFACLGFLPFNLRLGRNAAVFMGDSGSQVLGVALASLGLAASWTRDGTTVATVMLPLIVLAIPILDTTLVTFARIVERRPITQGGKDHASHRLVYYGLSEQKAVVLLATVAVALGATGLAYNVARQRPGDGGGACSSASFSSSSSATSSPSCESGPPLTAGASSLSSSPVAVSRGGSPEIVVDFLLMCGSFLTAYLFCHRRRRDPRASGRRSSPRFRSCSGPATSSSSLGGIYRRVWRYATTADALVIAAACGLPATHLVG